MPPVAEAVSLQQPPKPTEVPLGLTGRVDAIDNGRLYGWAFDRSQPSSRMQIIVSLGSQRVAEATADKLRSDLRRNGVGDGQHAFDIPLPESVTARQRDLSIVAVSPTGEERILYAPTLDEQAAEALIAAPLTRVLEKLEVLMAAQRQLQLNQRGLQRAGEASATGVDAPPAQLDQIEVTQTEIVSRLSELEVFLMRFDGIVAGLEGRIDTLSKRGRGDMKPLLIVMAGLTGAVIGAGVTLISFLT
ncbi:hypothetical protein [Kaistia terrae]|jgi:hypothetical protein|uniref:Polysaccharide chain length determinant N-terminal domain-containing protein n=1 Tax=Kaistia terrae TaxID=537017 RepID=A0ABW0PT10_9HYPH|nr:hypothetical protein [Kaistia terrae]MCX5577478.1 hypothetical protein [Kaistia terrae]